MHGTAQEDAPERVGRLKSPHRGYLDVTRLKSNLTFYLIYDNMYIENERRKEMKTITLTNEEIIAFIDNCPFPASFCEHCPLSDECLYYYTGEKCESALEKEE